MDPAAYRLASQGSEGSLLKTPIKKIKGLSARQQTPDMTYISDNIPKSRVGTTKYPQSGEPHVKKGERESRVHMTKNINDDVFFCFWTLTNLNILAFVLVQLRVRKLGPLV